MNLEICKSGNLGLKNLEIWKVSLKQSENLEICESGNLEIEPALYVADEVWISRFPDLFKLTFQISNSFDFGLTFQISRMNLVKQPRNQPGNNSSGVL